MITWKLILITVAIVYVGSGLFLFFAQKNLMYYPDRTDFDTCEAFKDAEKIHSNGTRMYLKNISDSVVIVYHGNAGSACDRGYYREFFTSRGYSYLYVEYTGFSNDTRSPSEKKIRKNVEDAARVASTFRKKIVFGESIGSGAAAYHAQIAPVDELILIAPFDSLKSVARTHYPMYPSFIVRENFDNIDALQKYQGNVHIFHGSEDRIVPPKLSERLALSLAHANRTIVENAEHNTILNYPQVWAEIATILEK